MIKKLTTTLFLWVLIGACSQSTKDLPKQKSTALDTHFDRGSLGPYRIINDTLVRAQTMHWIKSDQLGNQFYWFYFKVSNVQSKRIRFEFSNMAGIYRGNPHMVMHGILEPVISYDNKNWDRIYETHFNKETRLFTFIHTFEDDVAWIAYAHPYPKSRGDDLINLLREQEIDIEEIGHSSSGNQINMLTWPANSTYDPWKKVVLVVALQHAGEDCGGYFTEGIINELQKNADLADRYIYKIVPMMNPDGLYHGVTRYNYNMEDLNSEWDDDLTDTANYPVEPEVFAVKNWLKRWTDGGGKIDFAADIHSHSQKAGDCAIHIRDERLHELVAKINTYWPIRTNFKGPNPGKGNFLNFFTDEMNTLAVTMELSQSHNGDGVFLKIADYRRHGSDFVKAIDEFFNSQEQTINDEE